MLTIPGYTLTELIQEGVNTVIYRGQRDADGKPVIVKVLKHEYPVLKEISRLRQEYKISQSLNLPNIVTPYGLERYKNGFFLILEDFDGLSLKSFARDQPLEIKEFLHIAIQLAQAIGELHKHNIIHKDIKPSNIIINPQTKQVKITDFSIASRLSLENPKINNPNSIEGTLAYMSPEQTGRMNRAIDYRSDFYSLGVTFYELLAGRLPFLTTDPMELVHCHIALQPIPPSQLLPEIPPPVSDIILKLLAKTAEERYQSAFGLKADLEICLSQLLSCGEITTFIVGRQDRTAQFHIPQKLYGRKAEVAALLDAFERVSQGSSELMLVSGYSGIGKSSLVYEVHKPIVRQRGYFISGKFDQFKRNIPYAALIQSFSELMRQLLAENPLQIESWKAKLMDALGPNGQVIVDVIPEVQLLIGPQPSVPQLGPTESQNRFNRVFLAFVRMFARQEHPLVLFLDDLQWADSASLKLIQLLITAGDSQYLLLIGAYRDNEVSPTHLLMQTIQKIQSTGAAINNIVLRPLNMTHVSQLVADSLQEQDCLRSKPLAELFFNKTQGNPFFLTQLLKSLYQEDLLRYDFSTGQWQWDIKEIQAIGIIDKNIVELIAGNIQKLPDQTQQVLKLAACIGNRFNLDVLSIVYQQSASQTASDLWSALQSGLILPLSDAYKVPMVFKSEELCTYLFNNNGVTYRFLHDRVQQAAYSLIPESQKKATHLQVGQLLLQNASPKEQQENVFEIVNQLNIGREFITYSAETDRLAQLNLIAGKKAKAAMAYEPAVRYLTVGLELLAENSWQHQYDLTLALHFEAVEAEYLNANFPEAATLVEVLQQQAQTLLDQIKVYELKIQFYTAQNQMLKALEIGLQGLELLGFSLLPAPSQGGVVPQLPQLEDLEATPVMTDPYQLAALRILAIVTPAAFMTNTTTWLQVILTMANLCIEHGHSALAAYAYSQYGVVLCGALGDLDSGYHSGQLALRLLELFQASELKCKVYLLFNGFIRPWKEHAKESLAPLVEALHSGLETGDVEFAGYCTFHYGDKAFAIGEQLDSVAQQQASYIDLMLKFKQEFSIYYNKVWHQLTLNLQGLGRDNYHLIGESFDESAMLPYLQATNNGTLLFATYVAKVILLYLFKDYTAAVHNAKLAAEHAGSGAGMMTVAEHNFYYSLALLALYPHAVSDEQKAYMSLVEENQKIMQRWAEHAPANFWHKYELVEAEKARVKGQIFVAAESYDRAIQASKEQGYTQEEALANELAAEFYLSGGREKVAYIYWTDAYYGYIRWSAIAKAKDLEARYPQFLERITKRETSSLDVIQTKTSTTSSDGYILDLTTVTKASQTLSGEISLVCLLNKLMTFAIENAGAQKGFFLTKSDEQWVIEAVGKVEQAEVTVLHSPMLTPLASQEGSQFLSCLQEKGVRGLDAILPVSAINFVENTRQNLVLEAATRASTFSQDLYIVANQPKSILCLPLIHQDKLTGILYLENNLTEGAFTPERLEVLTMLTSQVSISIENARLYTNLQAYSRELEAKNTALTAQTQQLEQALHKLQQTQAQLVHTEKISSLGQLVAGVAHEVNNPVGFISGNLHHASQYAQDLLNHVQLYRAAYPTPSAEIQQDAENIDLEFLIEDLPNMLSSMKMGTDRIRDIMQSLRNFSRVDEAEKKPVDIHCGLESTLMILQHRLKAKPGRPAIAVVKEYGNLPLVECYAGQLNQVFMNLLSNAVDTLELGTGDWRQGGFGNDLPSPLSSQPPLPTIWIRTEVLDSNNVSIQITDNGLGMKEEVSSRLFEPFFTTKPIGKGTGLGLSISYSIVVEKHGGQLLCVSAPGEGARFIIQIPLR